MKEVVESRFPIGFTFQYGSTLMIGQLQVLGYDAKFTFQYGSTLINSLC